MAPEGPRYSFFSIELTVDQVGQQHDEVGAEGDDQQSHQHNREEGQQGLGRILRPKDRTSRFFTLITRNTVEEEFGSNRQKFLAEQGYSYKIIQYKDESSFQSLECARLAESESQ